jgi:hypothetical protein
MPNSRNIEDLIIKKTGIYAQNAISANCIGGFSSAVPRKTPVKKAHFT